METSNGDSLMIVSDGNQICLNLNDALHASTRATQCKFIDIITNAYKHFDYLFCGYGTASHFPNCYVVPEKDREKTAAKRQSYFNNVWAKLVHALAPDYAFPFAADVVFLSDDLFWANEIVHNGERPTEVFKRLFPHDKTAVIDIAPGFVIENNNVLVDKERLTLNCDILRRQYAESIRRVNSYKEIPSISVNEVYKLIEENVDRLRPFLETFDRNYRSLIVFKNCKDGIAVEKKGRVLTVRQVRHGCKADYDIIYTTRLQYLKRSLTSQYGHEVLFVGSGGIFEYASVSSLGTDVHRELICIMKKVDRIPTRAYGVRKFVSKTKQFAKRVIGQSEDDLYDIKKWTVFEKPRGENLRAGFWR
jgi:hypothetical protein